MQNRRGGKSHCEDHMPPHEGLGTMMIYCNTHVTPLLCTLRKTDAVKLRTEMDIGKVSTAPEKRGRC